MWKKLARTYPSLHRWLSVSARWDGLFAFTERSWAAFQQLMHACRDTGSTAPTRRPSYRPRIEGLEDRQMPSTSTWTGGGSDSNWSTSANWSAGVPGSGDTAIIGTPGGGWGGGIIILGGSSGTHRRLG